MACKTKGLREQYDKEIRKMKQRETSLRDTIDKLKRENTIYKGFVEDSEGFSEVCGKLLEKLKEGQYIVEETPPLY